MTFTLTNLVTWALISSAAAKREQKVMANNFGIAVRIKEIKFV